jgi:hypothetical protein
MEDEGWRVEDRERRIEDKECRNGKVGLPGFEPGTNRL